MNMPVALSVQAQEISQQLQIWSSLEQRMKENKVTLEEGNDGKEKIRENLKRLLPDLNRDLKYAQTRKNNVFDDPDVDAEIRELKRIQQTVQKLTGIIVLQNISESRVMSLLRSGNLAGGDGLESVEKPKHGIKRKYSLDAFLSPPARVFREINPNSPLRRPPQTPRIEEKLKEDKNKDREFPLLHLKKPRVNSLDSAGSSTSAGLESDRLLSPKRDKENSLSASKRSTLWGIIPKISDEDYKKQCEKTHSSIPLFSPGTGKKYSKRKPHRLVDDSTQRTIAQC